MRNRPNQPSKNNSEPSRFRAKRRPMDSQARKQGERENRDNSKPSGPKREFRDSRQGDDRPRNEQARAKWGKGRPASESKSSSDNPSEMKTKRREFAPRKPFQKDASSTDRRDSTGAKPNSSQRKSWDRPQTAHRSQTSEGRNSRDSKAHNLNERGAFAERGSAPKNDRMKKDRRGEVKQPANHSGKLAAKPREMIASTWSARGEAVLFDAEGRRTLIWSGIPHERAVVQLTHRGQNQQFGHVVSVEDDKRSTFRVEPNCKRYERCGGCPLMHMNEEGQAQAKRELYIQAISEAEISLPIPDKVERIGSDEGYRMVSKLVAGRAKHGALRLGARNRDGAIVPIPDCIVTDADLNSIGKRIAYLLESLEIFPYTNVHRRGMRYVVLRKSRESGQVLVTLVATHRTRFLEELAARIFRLPFAIAGVLLHLNLEEGNAIFSRDDEGRIQTIRLEGESKITEKVNGIEYEMGAGDFFQVNLDVAAQLQSDVVALSKRFTGHAMVDLYCGAGFFTLALAKEHGWSIGIEVVDGAIRHAKSAAIKQGLNAEFITGDVYDYLDVIQGRIQNTAPFIVIDPARRGMEDDVPKTIDELNPVAIAYVSCNPRSMAKDIVKFQELGWRVESTKLYDMFPHTTHLECLTLLLPPEDRQHVKMKSVPKRVRVERTVETSSQTGEQPLYPKRLKGRNLGYTSDEE